MKFEGSAEDHIRSDEHLEINQFNRQHSVLLIYCGDYFNFSLSFRATNSWGYKMSNGTFDGVVGALQSKSIEFGGSPIFLVKERYPVVDYGRRTWRLGSAFIFRHPRRKASFEVFLRPLEGIVWLVVVCSMLAIILILRFVTICERKIVNSTRDSDTSWSSLVLFVVGALCQQGTSRIPIFLSGRIVTIFVFVFAVLLFQFYSGSIVSYLLLKPTKTMTTIKQLAYSDLKIGCENVLYTKQYFKELFMDKDMDRLKQKKYKPNAPFYIPAPVGLELVAKGGYAFHVELATAYPIIEKTFSEDAICDLEEIPFFEARPVMAAFTKRSPFRDAINFCLQKMGERGLLNRHKKHYHARRPACIRSRAPASAVGLDEFYPALVILFFGILASVTILAMENVRYRMKRQTKRQKKVLLMKFEGSAEDHIRSDEHLEINQFNRQHSVLLIYCGDYFNFSLSFRATNSWGYKMSNGTFDGVVGALQSKSIEFGGSPIFLVKERYPVVDYGRRTWRLGSAFIFRHPRRKASFEVFLRPLEGIVWLVVVCSMLAIILILRFVTICERKIVNSTRDSDTSWSSLVLFVVGALCQQGTSRIPIFLSGRIVTIFVFVFAVLLFQFYSGSIVSYLLLKPTKTMTTIKQLAYSDLKIGCENVLYTKQYFKELFMDKDMDRLKQKKYKPNAPFYIPAPVGLELVAKGGYAFHVELATAYPIIEKTFSEDAICDLEEIPFFEARPVMAAFTKRSPFRDAINFCLQKMGERGLLNRHRKHYHARRPACIRSRAPASAVGLDEFYPALVILFFGILASLTILAMENVRYRMKRQTKRRKKVVGY